MHSRPRRSCGSADLLGRTDYLDAAEQTMTAALPIMERVPMAAGQMLLALDRFVGPSYELVLVGDMARDDMKSAMALIHQRYFAAGCTRGSRFDFVGPDRCSIGSFE